MSDERRMTLDRFRVLLRYMRLFRLACFVSGELRKQAK
jgi:hypothetical protein